MNSVRPPRNSATISALPRYAGDDVLYSPNKYRETEGDKDQQNAIDKAKGIICSPMPRAWYDYHANALPDDPTDEDIRRREINLSILADKKPRFMTYIYPPLMKSYNTYVKNARAKCIREFRITLPELMDVPEDERTEAQASFIRYYNDRMPVGTNNCVMNRICKRFEEEFDGVIKSLSSGGGFDPSIFKSGCGYTQRHYNDILKLYRQHNDMMRAYVNANMMKRDDDATSNYFKRENLVRMFVEESLKVCSNGKELCDIVIDICYNREGSKQFAWDVCSGEIINNLFDKNDGYITFPVRDDEGEFEYGGYRFTMIERSSKLWVKS